MTNHFVPIIKDVNEFQERVDEIENSTSYDTVKSVIAKIKDALYDNKDVVALCAPQIGEKMRVFVVKNSGKDDNRFRVCINPMIVSKEGLHLSRENSASFPGKEFIIPRYNKIHVAYQISDGHVNSETFIGAYAEVVQQMIEMLDGITLFDYGLDLDDLGGINAWEKATKKDKTEVLSMYLTNLKEEYGELMSEINADENLKFINDNINFMTGVLKGDITINKPDKPEEDK